jgi:EAL and modified HD-GYP domain-containing signal transduction protein
MSQTARFARATPGASAPAPVVVARQPIFDRTENVIGFELLRPPDPFVEARAFTASVLVESLADIGLPRLVGTQPAYVNVTRELLLAVRPLPLDPERVVLQLQASEAVDDALLAVLGEAAAAGFRIALDGLRPTDELLAVAGIVKLDAGRLGAATLAQDVAELRARGVTLIADGVETRAQYDACLALGFDGFQGRFFAEPVRMTGSATPTYRLRALSLLARGEATSFEQLERVIAEDPGLAHKLVKLANSAFFGRRHTVASIRQALLQLGSVPVRRWAALLTLAGVEDRPNHLLEVGLLRARLCELIAERDPIAEPERAFTTGLFSVMDALLRTPMSELLAELPFDERTTRALEHHEGPEGRLLAGVLAYEAGDFDACAAHGVRLVELAHAYREALDWTNDAALQLA